MTTQDEKMPDDLFICRRTVGGDSKSDYGTRYYVYEEVEPYRPAPIATEGDKRYEIRTGKYGQYFYDLGLNENMSLEDVLTALHSHRELLASYDAVVKNKDYFHSKCLEIESKRADDGWLAAIEFLLARLDEYEPEHHEAARDYYGHVEPAIARLKAALPPAPEGKS